MISFEETSKIFRDLYPQDEDHGIKHHETVFNILKEMLKLKVYDMKTQNLALFCAAIHDTMDGKYKNNEEEVRKRITEHTEFNADDVMDIVKNMSWSKRATNYVKPGLIRARDLAMYADWMDSIRLDRCISYSTRVHGPQKAKEKVIEHFNEKLKNIILDIPEIYRPIAEPLQKKLLADMKAYKKS